MRSPKLHLRSEPREKLGSLLSSKGEIFSDPAGVVTNLGMCASLFK